MDYERAPRPDRVPDDLAGRLQDAADGELDLATVDRVLHRAVQLQAAGDTSAPGLSAAALVRVAAEVGVTEGNLRRALAEVLTTPEEESGFWSWLLAPDRLVESQVVPGDAADVERRLADWMRQFEGLRLRRRADGGGVWEKDPHVLTRVRMALGGGRGKLRNAQNVTHRVAPTGAGGQVVSVAADTTGARAAGQAALAIGAAAGGAAVVGAAVGLDGVAQIGALAGAAAGTAAWIGAVVWAVRARVGRVRDGLRRVLDNVADPHLAGGHDSLAGQISRLQRMWWGRR